MRSPFGAVLRGIRENEAKTTALSYNTRLYKDRRGRRLLWARRLAPPLRAVPASPPTPSCCSGCCPGPGADHGDRRRRRNLVGPVLGAAFFMLMEHQLSAWTEWAPLFRPDLHRLRPVRPPGHLGLATTVAAFLTVVLLELDGVSRRFGAWRLDQVAMQVEEGEVRAVIGLTAPARPRCSTSSPARSS